MAGMGTGGGRGDCRWPRYYSTLQVFISYLQDHSTIIKYGIIRHSSDELDTLKMMLS